MLRARDLASMMTVTIMIVAFVILILKRKNLGPHRGIFMASIVTIIFVESYATINRLADYSFSSVPVYTLGVSIFLFMLFMLYFQLVIKRKKFKLINSTVILVFVIHSVASVAFIDRYIDDPPLLNYSLNVALLFASIIVMLADIFSSEKVLDLEHYFPFWACISIMVKYVGLFPLLVARYSIPGFNPDIFYLILLLVNILGYSVLLLGIFKAKNGH